MAISLPTGQHATSDRELAVLRLLGRQPLLRKSLIWAARISDHATVQADRQQRCRTAGTVGRASGWERMKSVGMR